MNTGVLPTCLFISLVTAAAATAATAQSDDPVGGWYKPLWSTDLYSSNPKVIEDCTGDGFEDLLFQSGIESGSVTILDGRLGGIWHQISQPNGEPFIVTVNDFDGDGVADLLLREPSFSGSMKPFAGRMTLIQGITAATVWSVEGSRSSSQMGLNAPIVDVDGDGLKDILAFTAAYFATAFSGISGHPIWSNPNVGGTWGQLGHDVSGDGVQDLLLCGDNTLTCLDGATGNVFWQETARLGKSPITSELHFVDLNLDGAEDVVFADYWDITPHYTYPVGSIWAFDGPSGNRLWKRNGERNRGEFGRNPTFFDWNADGIPDLLTVGPLFTHMLDGVTGDELWQKELPISMWPGMPDPFQVIDLNGDGVQDLITIIYKQASEVVALDCQSGAPIWVQPSPDGRSNWNKFQIEDVDGNGTLDVITNSGSAFHAKGCLAALNGFDGSEIWSIAGRKRWENLGSDFSVHRKNPLAPCNIVVRSSGWKGTSELRSIRGDTGQVQWHLNLNGRSNGNWDAIDLDGDGSEEVIDELFTTQHEVVVVNTDSGEITNKLGGVKRFIGSISDIDGDGVRDLLTSTRPKVETFSGMQSSYITGLELSADELSSSNGGGIVVKLEMPTEYALSPYQLLMSETGIGPMKLGSVLVPLSMGKFFHRSATGQYPSTIFFNPIGRLNALAERKIGIRALPGAIPPGMIGTTIYLAVVLGTPAGEVEFSSGAEAITITL